MPQMPKPASVEKNLMLEFKGALSYAIIPGI